MLQADVSWLFKQFISHVVLKIAENLSFRVIQVEELRNRLEEKNRMIEKKTQAALQSQQERNRAQQELAEMKEHTDIKDRKISVLQRKIENLEDLLKEKDNQVDMARARLTAMQAHHCSTDGALSSLEEQIGDKEKQVSMLRYVYVPLYLLIRFFRTLIREFFNEIF